MTLQQGGGRAWHFVGDTLRDGRPVPMDGETLHHRGPVSVCTAGLHWSRRVTDALVYAPGTVACRVEYRGWFEEEADKGASTCRTILWRVEARPVLEAFARRCALDVAPLWNAPPSVRRWLETGDDELEGDAWIDATISPYAYGPPDTETRAAATAAIIALAGARHPDARALIQWVFNVQSDAVSAQVREAKRCRLDFTSIGFARLGFSRDDFLPYYDRLLTAMLYEAAGRAVGDDTPSAEAKTRML